MEKTGNRPAAIGAQNFVKGKSRGESPVPLARPGGDQWTIPVAESGEVASVRRLRRLTVEKTSAPGKNV